MDNLLSNTFVEAVKSNFSYLVTEFSFSAPKISSRSARYESAKVFVEVLHGERDDEISISFGRLATDEYFSFTLFLRSVDPQLEKTLGERIVYKSSDVADCVQGLAAALRDQGKFILVGQDKVFEKMKEVRWWHFQPDALKSHN